MLSSVWASLVNEEKREMYDSGIMVEFQLVLVLVTMANGDLSFGNIYISFCIKLPVYVKISLSRYNIKVLEK